MHLGLNVFKVINPNNSNRSIYVNDQYIGFNNDGGNNLLLLGTIDNNEGYIELTGEGHTIITSNYIITPVLTQTSLATMKKNFEKLENGLDIIKATDIYKYNLVTQNDEEKKHIGFIIGDKYNYAKEITSNSNDGVDIYSMVSVAYKAIQEQQEIIEQLKESIEEMKKEENGNGNEKDNI